LETKIRGLRQRSVVEDHKVAFNFNHGHSRFNVLTLSTSLFLSNNADEENIKKNNQSGAT